MGGKKKKSDDGRHKEACQWAGKYRVLVKTLGIGMKYEFLVVDLKQNNIVTKHPGAVWSGDNWITSSAVLNKGIVSIMSIGDYEFENRFPIVVNEQDHVHSSNASTTTLDFTKTPPKWSNWRHAPELNFARFSPYLVSLHNKIFAFSGTLSDNDKAEVYEINKIATSKWDVISTVPHDGHLVSNVISDPGNHRLIAYFCKSDSLYAYYHKLDKWILIHQNICGCGVFRPCLSADQVVANVIYFFNTYDQRFEAYDIFANKWLKVHWFQFDRDHKIDFTTGSQLVYLGNDILCLAYYYRESMETKTMVQFLRLSVKPCRTRYTTHTALFSPYVHRF